LDIINAFEETGSLRAAAALCGTTHKTVKRVLDRRAAGQRPGRRCAAGPGLADEFTDLIFGKVKAIDGRITAKRLLPLVRAAGYTGSARTLRRAVAVAKTRWKRARRVYRPWTPEPGQHLLIDYGTVTHGPNRGLKVFTAVLAWSRWRFVRFTRDESLETTLRLLAECFEALGGVPAVVLADRMGCLKGGVVANVVLPTAAYVRFATHYLLTELRHAFPQVSGLGRVDSIIVSGRDRRRGTTAGSGDAGRAVDGLAGAHGRSVVAVLAA
jgi:transposase